MSEVNQALLDAWNQTTPYSQIKDSLGITADDAGQFDFVVKSLTPTESKPSANSDGGIYCIEGEFGVLAPAGFTFPYRRTLYIGTKKDKMAQLPETRLNSPGLRFLRNIAKANHLPTNDQSDAQLCTSLMGKAFGCRIEARPYTQNGVEKKGTDFGRNVTPAGMIPAKLDSVGAAATAPAGTNGSATTAQFVTE